MWSGILWGGDMRAYLRFGDWLGRHMAAVAPLCLIAAVIAPGVFSQLEPFVTPLFAFVTFQGALSNTFQNVIRAFRHPGPLLLILFVSAVVTPVLAYSTATLLFAQSPDIVCGIVLEYSVPVAVISTLWVGLYNGDAALGLATLLVSTVIAPFTIPLTLKLLLGAVVKVNASEMIVSMLVRIAIPAIVGIAVNDLSRGAAKERIAPSLAPASRIAISLVILANSTSVAPFVRNITPRLVTVVAFIGVFASLGFALGVLVARIAGQGRAQAVTTTFECGLRNISAGAVIAAEFFPAETMFPVICGTLFQNVLAGLFGSLVAPRLFGEADEEDQGKAV